MKTLLATLVATAALAAVAAPAAAQDWRGYGWGHDRWERADYNLDARQAQLNERIERGARDGSLTGWEAHRLYGESRDIAQLKGRYRWNGLSGWERADLDRRLDRLAADIARERHDDEHGYGNGYGYYRR